tara:strand:- start:549 stop:803 length:255 start_codon:yes stop_codon:yes gene_type:complete
MPKIQSNIKKIVFEDKRIVESIERIITAIELQEALQRLLTKESAKNAKLEEENKELKCRNDELKELIKQHHGYIENFPNLQKRG